MDLASRWRAADVFLGCVPVFLLVAPAYYMSKSAPSRDDDLDEAEKYSEAEEPLLSGDDRDPEAGVPNVPVPRSASHMSINRMHRIGSHVSSVGSARDKWEIYASVGSGAMGVSPASFAPVGSWLAGRGDRAGVDVGSGSGTRAALAGSAENGRRPRRSSGFRSDSEEE